MQKIEGLKSGADAYISKPFTIDLLDKQIDNLIKHNRELADHLHKERLHTPIEISPLSSDEKLLKSIVEFIETNMSDSDLTIDKIAKHTGFGHQYIYRKVKAYTGETLNEFVRNTKIRRAAQLLRSKKLSIAEVMIETGFNNHSYFSKCFRKVYKVNPTEYRASEP
jgi:AraC-like DNA-binding protein